MRLWIFCYNSYFLISPVEMPMVTVVYYFCDAFWPGEVLFIILIISMTSFILTKVCFWIYILRIFISYPFSTFGIIDMVVVAMF